MSRNIISILGVVGLSACVIGGSIYLQDRERIPEKYYEEMTTREANQDPSKIKVNNPDEHFVYSYYEPVDYTEAFGDVSELDGSLEAGAAILVDADTKTIVFEKDQDVKMAPASTTKLSTAITAVNILDMDERIKVGEEITMIGAGSSTAGLSQGEVLTFKELLQGLLLSSGNDAAYVIARAAGEKLYYDDIAYENVSITKEQAVARFVKEMNKNAKDLGLDNTHFLSPDGYDVDGQYTSAKDLSILALTALENDEIKEICGTTSVTTQNGAHTWTTTNELMHSESRYYYEYAIGLKTGSTDAAGKCLVSAAEKDGKTCISVVLNSTTEGRYEDSLKLLKYFEE